MAKTYRIGTRTRIINWTFRRMTELGMGASYRHILTVPGRKTGWLHSTPVDVIKQADSRWLVAGYGPANWVANARAARGDLEPRWSFGEVRGRRCRPG